jgi:thioredoxin
MKRGIKMIKYLKNEEEFLDLISDGNVLVDFYAEWCGPCKIMGEILESVDGNIVKVNTDTFPNLAQKFGIMSIPTLILFKNGSEADKLIGLQSKNDIIEFINK